MAKRTLRVRYDDHIFALQRYGGVSRYFVELFKSFRRDGRVVPQLPFKFSNNAYLEEAFPGKFIMPFDRLKFSGRAKVTRALNRLAGLVLDQDGGNFDVFHPTYYDASAADHLMGRPLVITIHDMIHERFRRNIQADEKVIQAKKALADRANLVIAVSESTKTDIVEILGISPERVVVVYHGIGEEFGQDVGSRIALPDRYILFVGNRGWYKNFKTASVALASRMKRDLGLHLVCSGGGVLSPEELFIFQQQDCAARVFHMHADDDTLRTCYKRAAAFIFPSLCEGFGFPIVEAFASGCPALVSDRSCFPEIARDGAVYFNPEEPASIEAAIDRVLDKDRG